MGLSPRVRGNPAAAQDTILAYRSIPACAGEPHISERFCKIAEVYPRVCGGTGSDLRVGDGKMGLSPRVRGNRHGGPGAGFGSGSIPACAGEPSACATIRGRRRVYPRVCGGTPGSRAKRLNQRGLSPRVRGNLALFLISTKPARSIPACAGEPGSGWRRELLSRVYPRVCGGTGAPGGAAGGVMGLSPRVRGNPVQCRSRRVRWRSIPACAGEPRRSFPPWSSQKVYPRVCGGTTGVWAISSFALGLSPRVRGNPAGIGCVSYPKRSIPACAGEPPFMPGAAIHNTVYPRVCGGTHGGRLRLQTREGLSPRVRGNPGPAAYLATARRSIPACAGEPECPPTGL